MSEKAFTKGTMEELAGAYARCGCGRRHGLDVRQIAVVSNAAERLGYYIKQCGGAAYFLVEENAARVCTETVIERVPAKLSRGGCTVRGRSADECSGIERNLPEGISSLVAIGGRNACQAGKYLSKTTGLPLIFVFVIPDDDDVLSDRSLLDGRIGGKAPEVVLISVNEACVLAKENFNRSAALVYSNLLNCLESKFNYVSKNTYRCGTADAMVAAAATDCARAVSKGYGKKSLVTVFSSLLRISAARAIAPGTYDTSFEAVCNLIEAKTGLGKSAVASAVFPAVCGVFKLVLDNYDALTVPEEVVCDKGEFRYSIPGIEKNRKALLAELEMIFKLRALIAPAAVVAKEVLLDALKNADFDGIIAYGVKSGLI